MTSSPRPVPDADPRRRTTLTARTPEDLLAVVPVVLGFHPEDSVVMLTFGARDNFHARVDLPADRAHLGEVSRTLLAPVRRDRVDRVVFLLYSHDARLCRTVARRLTRDFTSAGVDVVDVLRVDDGRWYAAAGPRRGVPTWGVPYDISAHPFVVGSVLEGRVTDRTREDLRASIAPDPPAVAAVSSLVRAAAGPGSAGEGEPDDLEPDDLGIDELNDELADLVAGHVAAGTDPDDVGVACLLVALTRSRVCDCVWSNVSRHRAREHVRFWSGVLRRAPDDLAAGPAAVLAFCAWLAGDGALAWCAVDRCHEVDPDHWLGGLVAECLSRAVPPSSWEGPGEG